MSEMYNAIERLCKERGISVGKMCADLEISRGVLGDLKAGRTKKLSAENLSKIAPYLGVTTDYLLQADKGTGFAAQVAGAAAGVAASILIPGVAAPIGIAGAIAASKAGKKQKEKPAANNGNGLTPEQEEIIRLYDAAPTALKEAALAVLRAASNQDKVQSDE